jgi:hypothetical protein
MRGDPQSPSSQRHLRIQRTAERTGPCLLPCHSGADVKPLHGVYFVVACSVLHGMPILSCAWVRARLREPNEDGRSRSLQTREGVSQLRSRIRQLRVGVAGMDPEDMVFWSETCLLDSEQSLMLARPELRASSPRWSSAEDDDSDRETIRMSGARSVLPRNSDVDESCWCPPAKDGPCSSRPAGCRACACCCYTCAPPSLLLLRMSIMINSIIRRVCRLPTMRTVCGLLPVCGSFECWAVWSQTL